VSDRRAPGTGSIIERRDSAGRTSYYGKWTTTTGRQVKRRIGRKRSAGTSDGLTRRQAEAELRRLMAEVKVAAPARERLTVAEVGERYVAHLERTGRKRSTTIAVRMCLRAHLVPFFGDKSIAAITHNDVGDLINVLEVDKELAPKSIHNYVGTLSALFNFAMGPRRRWASQNPCQGAELPKVAESVEIRWLDLAEVDLLVEHAQSGDYEQIDRALYRTAAMTGLRQGEAIALRWRDVDWLAARIRVRQNYVRGEFGTPKSRRSTRSVPMFADPRTGGPLERAAVLRRYRHALKGARLDKSHRFHDLRHTFGTRMAAAGVPIRTLQEWMGHRDQATTLRYADYAPSPHEAEMVAAAFARQRSTPVVSEATIR
jgi:integrase